MQMQIALPLFTAAMLLGTAAALGTEAAGLGTPSSIKAEHAELHATLARAEREPGELGVAAAALHNELAPHFKREEEIATPPLGLLLALSRGAATAQLREVLPMTEALERELPQMLQEHARIRAAVQRLETAARAANRAEYVEFAHALAAHARQEEEILYPAAVLVGRYVARTAPEK